MRITRPCFLVGFGDHFARRCRILELKPSPTTNSIFDVLSVLVMLEGSAARIVANNSTHLCFGNVEKRNVLTHWIIAYPDLKPVPSFL